MNTNTHEPDTSHEPSTLLLRDPRLKSAYPIIEVAKIAATFPDEHPRDKVIRAIGLLAATEYHALHANETEFRNIQTFRRATRHEGQILQTELILDICNAAGLDYTEETARGKYRKWLQSDWNEHTNDLEYRGIEIGSIDDYAALFETGRRPKFFKSDGAAKEVIERFSSWLDANKPATGSERLRDPDSQVFISGKDKGAAKGEDGKFKRSSVPYGVEHVVDVCHGELS